MKPNRKPIPDAVLRRAWAAGIDVVRQQTTTLYQSEDAEWATVYRPAMRAVVKVLLAHNPRITRKRSKR